MLFCLVLKVLSHICSIQMTLSRSYVTVFSEPTSSERLQEFESQKFGSNTDIDSLGENDQEKSDEESEYVFLGKFLFLICSGGGSGT